MSRPAIIETKLSWSHASQQLIAEQERAPGSPGPNIGRFIKGPIPLDWIGRAACLPGKTLHVALALQYLAGLQKTQTVKLGAKALSVLGVARDAKYDALNRLQDAGLIAVQRARGRTSVVTLLIGCSQKADLS